MNRESGTVPFRNEPPAGFESLVTVGTGDYRTNAIVRTSEELLKTITKRNKRGKAEGGVLAIRTMVSWRRRHSSFSLGVGHQPATQSTTTRSSYQGGLPRQHKLDTLSPNARTVQT